MEFYYNRDKIVYIFNSYKFRNKFHYSFLKHCKESNLIYNNRNNKAGTNIWSDYSTFSPDCVKRHEFSIKRLVCTISFLCLYLFLFT